MKVTDGDGRDIVFNVRFPGQYYDSESHTSYNYFRTYDQSLGRYIQSDPIGLNGGINTFGYVGGNPFTRIDRFGLAAIEIDIPPVLYDWAPEWVRVPASRMLGGIILMTQIPRSTPLPGTVPSEKPESCPNEEELDCEEVFQECFWEVFDRTPMNEETPNQDQEIRKCVEREAPQCLDQI